MVAIREEFKLKFPELSRAELKGFRAVSSWNQADKFSVLVKNQILGQYLDYN